ncbi:MAG: Hcp family type VI secretion system effector [Maricaulaceae bacterium]
MAHDAYLKIPEFEARLADAVRPGWIRLREFSHDISQTASGSVGLGEGGPGRAEHGDFRILKEFDEASPRLALACCASQRFPKAVLEVCESDNFQLPYVTIEFRDMMVRSVQHVLPPGAGGQAAGRVALEWIALRYRRIDWTYAVNIAGTKKGVVHANWDVTANVGG